MRAGDKSVPIPKIEPPTVTAFSTAAFHIENPCEANFIKPPAKPESPIILKPADASGESPDFASSPARRTSAVATPSGYCNLASTISARRNGTVNNTPITPPIPAIFATSQ